MKKPASGRILFAAVTLALVSVTRLQASDHIDSPTLAQDRGSDIADVWAFLDPNASRISVRKGGIIQTVASPTWAAAGWWTMSWTESSP